MNMTPAPAAELLVLMSPAPIPELSAFTTRIQLRAMFVFTHYYVQLFGKIT